MTMGLAEDLQTVIDLKIIYGLGSHGVQVGTIQSALLQLGFNPQGIDDSFGPKTQAAVIAFQKAYSIGPTGQCGPQTLAMLLQKIKLSSPSTEKVNQKLLKFYSTDAGYKQVYIDVMSWYGTTSNGCAAFVSSALRAVGVAVPHGNGTNGYDVSLVAQSLAEWLLEQGWQKITKSADLQPGDIIVTKDNPEYPGFAAHIFMFVDWETKTDGTGVCIDNQGFTHARNIVGSAEYSYTPWSYALRSNV